MNKAMEYLITLDVYNSFSKILEDRIKDAETRQNMKVYVGDCVEYTIQLCMNNRGFSPMGALYAVPAILKNVLCWCFQNAGIVAAVKWSDDMNYIIGV